jgi:hypothetical protein
VRAAMDELKDSKQAIGASTLTAAQMLAPPTVLAQASRLNFSTRLFNLLVTNIPGPQLPLYMLGRQLLDLFPIAFLPQNHALAIALMSYNGAIDYGLLGDFDALDDIELIASGIEAELALLVNAAHAVPQPGAVETVPSDATTTVAGATTETPTSAAANGSGGDTSNGAHPGSILPTAPRRSSPGPASDMRAKRARHAQPPPGRSTS